jgi:small subunit ribosomal protein S17e
MSDRHISLYMGNIRPTYIKKITRELLAQRGYAFGTDFETNKAQVIEHTDITSKTIRNRVAGYITRRSVIAQREKPL